MFFQFLSPKSLLSWSTQSSQLNLGLPIPLFPSSRRK
jgi:hypothetical protein